MKNVVLASFVIIVVMVALGIGGATLYDVWFPKIQVGSQAECHPAGQAYRDHAWQTGCLDANAMNAGLADGNIKTFPWWKLGGIGPDLHCSTPNFHDGKFHPGCLDMNDLEHAGVYLGGRIQ